MKRRPSPPRRTLTGDHPVNLRARLEAARLDLRALFRALDEMGLAQGLPSELQDLMELDADFAEALWVLDQPVGRFDLAAMTRDTLASFAALPATLEDFFALLPPRTRTALAARVTPVRSALHAHDAYLYIPGRDPQAG